MSYSNHVEASNGSSVPSSSTITISLSIKLAALSFAGSSLGRGVIGLHLPTAGHQR